MAFTVDHMLGNAGTASQHLPLVDDPVVRGAVIRSIAQWLQLRTGADHIRDADLIKELQAHEDWHS